MKQQKHQGKRQRNTPYKIALDEQDIAIFMEYCQLKARNEYKIGEQLAEKYHYSNKSAIYRAIRRAEALLGQKAPVNKQPKKPENYENRPA